MSSRAALHVASLLVISGACTGPAAAQTASGPRRVPLPLPLPPQQERIGQPDLVVAAIREDGGQVAADIRNNGTGSAGATTVSLFVSGRQVAELDLAALGAGELRTVRFARPSGAVSIQVMVDRPNRVAESNEANNRPPVFALSTTAPGRAIIAARTLAGLPSPVPASPPNARVPRARPIAQEAPAAPVTEIVPPLFKTQSPASGVLRAKSFSQMMGGFKVVRNIPIATIRANPVVALAGEKLDFRPMLADQAALPNVAQRLRAQPQLAAVLGDKTEVIEIESGLLVRNFLSYRLKPGACTNPERAALVRRTGAQCPSPVNDDRRAKAMADPDDVHYIADGKRRAAMQFKASIDSANQLKAIRARLPQLRANLAGAPGIAQFGAAEAQRLSALGDEQLLDEIAKTAVVNTEEYTFIPTAKPWVAKPFLSGIAPSPYKATFAGIGKGAAAKPLAGHHDLTTQYFLTGFTTGRSYEWRKRAEVTIDWCIVGCSETYYAEVYATFGYAFGLRFPIALGGTYTFENGMAFVTPTFTPVNGDGAKYALTGLPAAQIHEGKEFVAEVEFSAGLNYKVPILGEDGVSVGDKLDFTDYLEKPFAGGEVLPPAPGKSSPPMVKVIDQIDLLGGRADFGIAGARVHPIVEVKLESTDLHFTVRDEGNGKPFEKQVQSGERTRLTYDPATKVSKFSIGDPVYALDFLITPGIRPKLFVDVAVWSYDWHADLTFPQFAVKLPPGGATFSCHANTICARNYEFSPDTAKESQGMSAAPSYRFDQASEAPPHWYWGNAVADKRPGWAYAFDDEFFAQCPPKDINKECEGKLKSIRSETLMQMSAVPAVAKDKYKSLKPTPFMPQATIDQFIAKDVMKMFDAAAAKARQDAAYAIQFYRERYK